MTESNHTLESTYQLSPQRPFKVAKTTKEEDLCEGEEEEEQQQKEENMGLNPRMQRYLVAIEYVGARFSGSQKQASKFRTVVGVLEEAFLKFIGQPVSVACSSRTDAGVHALSNVFHVDIERISKRKPGEVLPHHEAAVVRRAMNHFLQKNEGDISVIDVRSVPADFHARYKALERIYFYRLLSGPERLSTFDKDRAWHIPEELDLQAMQNACKVLVGHHDFSSFRASGSQAKSPIRTLDELHLCEVVPTPYFPTILERKQNNSNWVNSQSSSFPTSGLVGDFTSPSQDIGFGIRKRHRSFVVTARSRSFLYHQIRLLVGVLKSVGTGNLTISDVERILESKNVSAASPMAPSCGLDLKRVKYDFCKNENNIFHSV